MISLKISNLKYSKMYNNKNLVVLYYSLKNEKKRYFNSSSIRFSSCNL